MKTRNLWTIGGVLLMLAIVVTTVFTGILPTYTAATQIDELAKNQEAQNILQGEFLAGLQNKSHSKEDLAIALSEKQQLMPTKLNAVEFVHGVNAIAASTGVTLRNVSVSQPRLFVAPTSVSGSSSVSGAQASVAQGHLFVANSTIEVSGSLVQLANFADQLRTAKRYAQINSVAMPDLLQTKAGAITLDLNLQIFMLKNQ